jgi:cell division protein FtsX
MRIPVKAGRAFTADDRPGNLPVAIVNERLVQRWLAGRSPIGLRITVGSETRTIVGVAGDVRNFHLNVNPAPTLYVPYDQRPTPSVAFVLRSAGPDQAGTVRAATTGLAAIDRTLVVRGGRPFREVIAESLGGFDMTSVIVSILGIVSLGLAAIGIYSAVAFSVARRTREIGVRVALGASPGQLARGVVGEGVRIAAAGAIPGLLLSLAVGKALSAQLHRVSAVDPLVLGVATSVVLLTVVAASYLPARRAVRVDPMVATRGE